MQIKETLGVSKESILNKEHNLWVGVSFGNKWFTKENLEELLRFGLNNTKSSLLVWVPGRLHATNLRYFDNLSRSQSLKKAFEIGDEKAKEVEEIIANLPSDDQKKVLIASYDEVLTPKFLKQKEVLMREFAEQGDFYREVIEISEEMLSQRDRTVSKDRAESVALYVLQELPAFIDGLSKAGTDTVYNVVLYPGLGKTDELVVKILNDKTLAGLRNKLKIENNIGIVSVE